MPYRHWRMIYAAGAVGALMAALSLPVPAGAAAPAAAVARKTGSALSSASVQNVPGSRWGLLANEGFDGHGVKSVYFFAGNWRSRINPTSFYEYPVGPNDQLYTLHPSDAPHLGWSERPENRDFALNTMTAAGVNVVTMSFWGERGLDRWAFWAPMQTSTYAHDELFTAAANKSLLIIPAIESGNSTRSRGGHSPAYHFAASFIGQEAPQDLVRQIEDLVNRYVRYPLNRLWPRKWAQLYDRNGVPRYAINILHVASTRLPSNANEAFARGFDVVADKVFADTGVRVGFTLDLLPAKHTIDIGDGDGRILRTDTYVPAPAAAGPYLRQTNSVLAVQAFISEIWQGTSDQARLVEFKRQYTQGWLDQGLPVILDLSSGYDAHLVFSNSLRYGNNDAWRNALGQLRTSRITGITFNTWNGYTEGYAAVPTQEFGDSNYHWLQHLFIGEPWESHYAYFINGQPAYVIYGAICEKWLASGGDQGPLGAPRSGELDGQAPGERFSIFVFGRIYWGPQDGAHEVHGAVYDKYLQVNAERGPLGLPTTDEAATADGVGRYNHFQSGSIYWSPDTGAHEVHGAIHQKWSELGWERSRLGYPVSDELPTPDGLGRRNQFQGGAIWWYPDRGAFVQ